MKTFTINFTEFAKETTFRFDVDFVDFNKVETKRTYPFRYFFDIENFEKKERMKLLEEISDDDFHYAEIGNATKQGDVKPEKLNFNDRNELVEDYFKKIEKGEIQKVNENNILLAKVRPNLKKYLFIDNEKKNYFYTTAFINLKPKKLNKIFYYSFRTIFYNDLMAISRQGKGYPTLKEDDLYSLKFDKKIIDKLEKSQDQIVSKIEPIEKGIKELKSQIKDPQEIINQVFSREFGFDLEKFEESKKEKFFEVDFSDFANDEDLKFNYSCLNKLKNSFIIPNVKYVSLRSIAKNIFAGGDKPKDFSEEKDEIYKYPIFSNGMQGNDLQGFSKTARVYETAVTISARGTIGKAILRKEPYLPIVRLINIIFDENKILGEYLENVINFLNLEKAGNTIAQLTAPMVKKIKIPLPDLNIQQKIVDEIKKELDKQEGIKKQIEEKRNEIEEIIEEVVG